MKIMNLLNELPTELVVMCEVDKRRREVYLNSRDAQREERRVAKSISKAERVVRHARNYCNCMSELEQMRTGELARMCSGRRGKKKTHISGSRKPNPDMHEGVGAMERVTVTKRFRNSRLTCVVKTNKF